MLRLVGLAQLTIAALCTLQFFEVLELPNDVYIGLLAWCVGITAGIGYNDLFDTYKRKPHAASRSMPCEAKQEYQE